MARWYSKRIKAKYTADFKQYGFIPSYWRIAQAARAPYYSKGGLELCDFDDECEFCRSPKKGTYASISGYEQPETDFYICGKCAVKNHKKEYIANQSMCASYSNFEQWKRKQNLNDGQFICSWCDSIVSNQCDCNGAKYNIENHGIEYYQANKSL